MWKVDNCSIWDFWTFYSQSIIAIEEGVNQEYNAKRNMEAERRR